MGNSKHKGGVMIAVILAGIFSMSNTTGTITGEITIDSLTECERTCCVWEAYHGSYACTSACLMVCDKLEELKDCECCVKDTNK